MLTFICSWIHHCPNPLALAALLAEQEPSFDYVLPEACHSLNILRATDAFLI